MPADQNCPEPRTLAPLAATYCNIVTFIVKVLQRFLTFGAKVLGIFVLVERKFHRNESSMGRKFQAANVPRNESSTGTKVLSVDFSLAGTKSPDNQRWTVQIVHKFPGRVTLD